MKRFLVPRIIIPWTILIMAVMLLAATLVPAYLNYKVWEVTLDCNLASTQYMETGSNPNINFVKTEVRTRGFHNEKTVCVAIYGVRTFGEAGIIYDFFDSIGIDVEEVKQQ